MVRRKTVKRGRKTIKHRISSRKLVSSSLRKSFPRDQKGMPKIYVINLKKDKTKWKKYKEDHKKGIIDRYSACLGIDPQTKYRSKFKENEGRLQIMWNAAEKKKKCTAGILTSHLGIVQKIHSSKHSFPKNGVLIIDLVSEMQKASVSQEVKKIKKDSEARLKQQSIAKGFVL